MRQLPLLLAALAASLVLPAQASAIGPCGLPTAKPIWFDFGTPELASVFGKPGVNLAVSSGDFPAQLRKQGARTVYWDMHLNKRVGRPSAPEPAGVIVERANRLFDYAAGQSACAAPWIALNELFGASLETPWTASNTQYRENVLTFLRTLSSRGARPFLLLSSAPYTGSDAAADWWRAAARHADLVPEVYFSGPSIHRAGAIVGNRRMRVAMRRAIAALTGIGIPRDRVGIVLGFQTGRGAGGREGLQPAHAWFEAVKWQALAARQVAGETGIGTIWSWGWGSYREDEGNRDKGAAGCVYLWTRDPRLCDGPAAAGPEFDTSLTEGQIRLGRSRQCSFGARFFNRGDLSALQRLTGDREIAYSALLARAAEARYAPVPTARVLGAERAVIATRFRGSRGAYTAAVVRAGATIHLARAVLADELRRLRIEERFRARRPPAREVTSFYEAYPELLTRLVEAKPAPWWLGGRTRGYALSELAPGRLFTLPTGRKASVRALDGVYRVRVLGETQPLGSLPLARARPAIAAALSAFERRAAFDGWSVGRQTFLLGSAICRGDDLPAPGTIRLTSYLPFLELGA